MFWFQNTGMSRGWNFCNVAFFFEARLLLKIQQPIKTTVAMNIKMWIPIDCILLLVGFGASELAPFSGFFLLLFSGLRLRPAAIMWWGSPLLPLQSRGIRELQVTRNKWWRLVVNRIGTQRKSSTIVAKKPQCRCVLWLPIISDVCSSEISTPMQKLTSFVCVTIRWNWFVYRW